VLAQDVLAGTTLRVPAREDRREPPHDFPVLRLGGPAFLVAHLELLEDIPRGVQARPEMIRGDVALS
jgi:hypothetical protein